MYVLNQELLDELDEINNYAWSGNTSNVVDAISEAQKWADTESELSISVLDQKEKTRIKSSKILEEINPIDLWHLMKVIEWNANTPLSPQSKKCLMIISGYTFRYFKSWVSEEYKKIGSIIAQKFTEYTNKNFDHRVVLSSINRVCSKGWAYSDTDKMYAHWLIDLFDKYRPFKDSFKTTWSKWVTHDKEIKQSAQPLPRLKETVQQESLADTLFFNFKDEQHLIQLNNEQKAALIRFKKELEEDFIKDRNYKKILRQSFQTKNFSEMGNAVHTLLNFIKWDFKWILDADKKRILKLVHFRTHDWPKNK